MRYAMFPSLVAITFASLASGQSGNQAKKPSAILATAQFVSVEPYSGTDSPAAINDPHVSVEDREAVANVQKAILNWGQYKITIRRSEADLVVFVRKGRIASANGGIHVHAGNRNSTPGGPTQSDDHAVGGLGGGEIGPNEDIFWVYSQDPDGKLTGPIWRKNLKDGLDPQELVLFEKFKKDVATSIASQAKNQASARQSTP
jgi:hypothetical protein